MNNFIAVGNEELTEPIGEKAPCPHCGKEYLVENSVPPTLQFVKCENGNQYLVGIKGKKWIPKEKE